MVYAVSQSFSGDCETAYTFHEVPQFNSYENWSFEGGIRQKLKFFLKNISKKESQNYCINYANPYVAYILKKIWPDLHYSLFSSFFLGDCETAYTIHEVPQYEAMEIEDRLFREENYRSQREHLAGGLTQAAAFCKGIVNL